jgi:dipeptidyl aminopeptidase/acylaminoacyl peptidase
MGVTRSRRFTLVALTVAACSVMTACTAPTTPTESAGNAPEHPTLHTLVDAELGPSSLELQEVIEDNPDFTTTTVTYSSGEVSVTGALSVPSTDGPHPGLVLVHGVVNPDIYLAGSGLVREQAYFARAGYVVLSLDLRNSTAEIDSAAAMGIDLGSTLDVINGIRALQSSRLATLDEQRVALLGHSLGGLLTLNTIVTRPTLVDAAVALAPASIDPSDNVDYLTTLFGSTPARIVDEYGTPADNPEFWRAMSPRSLVDRVEVPLFIAHGTADNIIPYEWSEETVEVWKAAGKDVELVPLEGEGHVFQSRWEEAMALSAEFLGSELGR